MALTNFIPEVWSARILNALDKQLVFANLFNTDYEGEIANAGDSVHIGMIGDVTVKDYTRESEIDAPDYVKAEDLTLVVDQADYFNIAVDDLNKVQAAADLLDKASGRAGYSFADKADQYFATLLTAAAGTTIGTLTAPTAIDKDTAYELVVQLKLALDKAKCPKAGRKAVVPAEFEAAMLLDNRFVAVGSNASDTRLAEGTVYKCAGLEILVSDNSPVNAKGGSDGKTAVYDVIATCDLQGTRAEQVNKVEAYRPEKGFADAVKGLHLYGGKVLRPELVIDAKVSF